VRELVQKLSPKPISLLHARALRFRDFLTVALMVDKPDLFADNWIYIHDPSVKVGRVQNFGSWSRNGAGRHGLPRPRIFLLRG
jgi:protoporphyrinogen oxidase